MMEDYKLVIDNKIEKGFVISEFIRSFDITFQDSENELKIFFEENKGVSKWIICSDFVLNDKNKPNDVMTFSIIPYIYSFKEYMVKLKDIAPKDIKNCRNISNKFIKFFNEFPMLNISIILSKDRKLDYIDEKNTLILKISNAIEMYDYWKITTPEHKELYKESIKNFTILRNELNKKCPNLRIIRDIDILATLTSYLAVRIVSLSNIKLLSWLPDRDAMLSFKKKHISIPFVIDLINSYYYVLCSNSMKTPFPKIIFDNDNQNIWYDELVKIPDLIAGTVADLDFKNYMHSHKKFLNITNKILINNKNIKIFKIDFHKNNYSTTTKLDIPDNIITLNKKV